AIVHGAGDRAAAVAAVGGHRQRAGLLGKGGRHRRVHGHAVERAGGGGRAVAGQAPAGEVGAGGRRFREHDLVAVVDRRRTRAVGDIVDGAGDRAAAVAAVGGHRERPGLLGKGGRHRRVHGHAVERAGGGGRAVAGQAPAGEVGAGGRRFREHDLVAVVD